MFGNAVQRRGVDKALPIGDLFRAGDLQALAFLHDPDIGGRIQQRCVRAGVEPGKAASHQLDMEIASFQITSVEIGDFQFAARRRRSEEHTSELQSLMRISYAVFCLKTKKKRIKKYTYRLISKVT